MAFWRPRLPFWTSSGLWAILWSVSNPLSLLRQLSLYARLFSESASSIHRFSHRASRSLRRSVSTVISYGFQRTGSELLLPSTSHEAPTGFGPVLTQRVRLRISVWCPRPPCTLLSPHRSVWPGLELSSTLLHLSEFAVASTCTAPCCRLWRHPRPGQFSRSWLTAPSGLARPHSSFVTVR